VGIKTGAAARYVVLPGLLPRIGALFFSGFDSIPYLMAVVYGIIGLLPRNHEYLRPNSYGTYGIRHVVAAAARELKFEWKYIDRIVLFAVMLVAIVMMAMYLVTLLGYVVFSPAFAGGIFMPDYFVTPYPDKDVAFMMLDRVLGIPGLYDSEVSYDVATYGPFPNPFQVGLQAMFAFYSMGLFLISVFIFLVYVLEAVFEVTQTGKPVVELFQDSWMPFRLVAALGLLIPISFGLNSAQWIVLYSAKLGSGLATNAWYEYNNMTGDNPAGLENKELIARPSTPDTVRLIKDLLLIRACIATRSFEAAFGANGTLEAQDYVVTDNDSKRLLTPKGGGVGFWVRETSEYTANPWSVGWMSADAPIPFAGFVAGSDQFSDAVAFSGGGDIRLVFGYKDESGTNIYKDDYPGGVIPLCGEVVIPVTSLTGEGIFTAEGYLYSVVYTVFGLNRDGDTTTDYENDMDLAVSREWSRTSSSYRTFLARNAAAGGGGNPECFYDTDNDGYESLGADNTVDYLGKCTEQIPPDYIRKMISHWIMHVFNASSLAGYDYLTGEIFGENPEYSLGNVYYPTLGFDNPLMMSSGVLEYGWGGAGIWYNKISERNGSLLGAVNALPSVVKYPLVMEKIKGNRGKQDAKVQEGNCNVYDPNQSGNADISLPNQKSQFTTEEAVILHNTCKILHENEAVQVLDAISKPYPNPVKNMMAAIFGSSKLFNFDDNTVVTPMAQLSALGKALIDKAILNLLAGAGSAAIGGLSHILGGMGMAGFNELGAAFGNLSQAAFNIATIGLSFGVLLHYILPMLPFIYFFFAVGRWVKTIFEALVGVPLWAMAHLRHGGPGLPGQAAMGGYVLILEIFIRPVVTVLALVASFATFAAMVGGLNAIFELVVTNVTGFDVADLKSGKAGGGGIFGFLSNLFGWDPADLAGGDPKSLNYTRGIIDQFFMTILYILIVYSIGLTSFKLIDLIPDGIIRWIGVGVSSWGASDNADDILYQLDDKMAQQSVNMTMRLQSATQGVYGAAAGWGVRAERAAAVEAAQKAAAEKAVQQRAAAEAAATKPPEKN
jgi:hypothetical protein